MQNSEISKISEFFYCARCLLLCPRINDQLRTAEQGQGLPAGFVRHLRVPDLGGAAVMHAGRKAGKRPFAGSAQETAREFEGVSEGPVIFATTTANLTISK